MSESCPSLEIRLCEDEIQVWCHDYLYMESVLEDYDSFMAFLDSNGDNYFNFVNESQVEDLGSYLRSNGVPYFVSRDGEVIDSWKPTCDANGEGLNNLHIIDMELAKRLRSNGYITLRDIYVEGYESIKNDLDLSGREAHDIWKGVEKILED